MKNAILLTLMCVLTLTASAQIPKEAYDLTNSLYDLWRTSPKEKAVDASVKLNKLYQPFLIDNLHDNLSQMLQDRTNKNPQDYLKALWDLQDPSIRSLIEPMYIWNQSFELHSMAEASTTLQTYYALLKDSSNIKAKTELYGLLILKNLAQKKLVPAELQTKVLDKIIANLQQYPYIDTPGPLYSQIVQRGWHRYLLAYSMYLKYRTEGENPEWLKAAAIYSPDVTDMQRRDGYFYDAYLLEGDNKNVGFQSKYISYLEKNKLFKEELELLLESAYGVPVYNNIQKIKDFLPLHPEMEEYKILWSRFVNSKMQQAPAIHVSYGTDTLDFTKSRDTWTLIDVWGTWCSPCCKELPHLNEVANKYNSLSGSLIRLRTFSYFSTNLKEFMSKNSYTFPVAEIADEVTKPFGINSYPTKLFVSPDNKFLVIPFNVNWEEYMRNYCNIE